ncbi:MAG: hypothetical protein HN828_05820 [Candidatus Thioglobus sp.]|jgi:hypothetical protein|uniref:hypothetical protein n=1 Tax=Candidatus Thioglobus sp. TaxID=2026721 RepID=UPI001EC0D250|nr:hypothetical protein [Candidatus Thioglobus sp.]MBT3186305.1 hypothetical protein [Candidatus Thioglobus sp.]MBT3964900.1 hypothetical protein [Candidatus Thioglobus sp.]MBT4553442.1 hypothetical protein [Candidatus Thioglobus sp.]MBT4923779.1 hypothetical protein [Candidatus Thioglobus sp.]MBT5286807.1 hypothetical protein [Candidatus Thioglobus sp.]
MVLLAKLSKLFFYALLLSFNSNADTATKEVKVNPINEKIEKINIDLLDLEVQFKMGVDAYDLNAEARDIENQLLYHEYVLGTPSDNDEQWNETEQVILDAKIKLRALGEKIKLEGDWGRIRLRMQDFRGSDPGAVKLRYNYGF